MYPTAYGCCTPGARLGRGLVDYPKQTTGCNFIGLSCFLLYMYIENLRNKLERLSHSAGNSIRLSNEFLRILSLLLVLYRIERILVMEDHSDLGTTGAKRVVSETIDFY